MALVFIALSLLHPLQGFRWGYLPQEPGLCLVRNQAVALSGCLLTYRGYLGALRQPPRTTPPTLDQLNRASQAKLGLSSVFPKAQT